LMPGANWRRSGRDQRAYRWGRPPWFERVGEEFRTIRERVGLIDLTSFGHLTVADVTYTNGDLHFSANGHDYTVHLLGANINLTQDILFG